MLKDAEIFSLYKSHLHQNDHKSLRQNRHYHWFQLRLANPVQVLGLTDSSAVYIFSNKFLPLYDPVQRIHHECHSHLELIIKSCLSGLTYLASTRSDHCRWHTVSQSQMSFPP